MNDRLTNSRHRDSSSKIIFEDPILCAQFLRGYLDIPILKDVQPEDIEDVSERYVHLFVDERDSDVVKRVRLRRRRRERGEYGSCGGVNGEVDGKTDGRTHGERTAGRRKKPRVT